MQTNNRMAIITIIFVIAEVIFRPTSLLAQENGESRENLFLEFFVGNCLLNMPDIKRIEAAARVMKWKTLEDDMAAMMAPAEPGAAWQGWGVKENEEIYMVGVSEARIDGKNTVSCTVAIKDINQDLLVKIIETYVKVSIMHDQTDTLQRHRFWLTTVNDVRLYLNLTTIASRKLTPASLSAIMILQ